MNEQEFIQKIKSLKQIKPDDGWIAFNIKDTFLTSGDSIGYKDIIQGISKDDFSVHQRKRYRHRFSLGGEELNYTAIVGKKIRDVNLNEILLLYP